jgi:pimeloyl-ACP methyl ester carboxylesterase
MTYRTVLFLFLILFSWLKVSSQHLNSAEHIRKVSKEDLQKAISSPVEYGIDFYKITYHTTGSDGKPDIASGVVVIPDNKTSANALVIYHHGTSNSRQEVPSSLNLDYNAYAYFGGSGFAVIAPDYLGMGESRGFHPYLHRQTQASATIDMLKAFHEWAASEDFTLDTRLFLTGYSQGGHASMSTHRELEENYSLQYPVTAAAHLSGPYSLSSSMREIMFSETDYDFFGYIPYLILGYQEVHGDLYTNLSDIFKPDFVPHIQSFYNGTYNLTQLTIIMVLISVQQYGNRYPINIFNPDIVESLRDDDNHRLNQLLRENDTYNFAPKAPTRLLYCRADGVVPYINSLEAETALKANGASDVQAIDVNPALDHGPCATPAVTAARDFFNTFLQPTAIDHSPKRSVVIYPNPTTGHINIPDIQGDAVAEFYDFTGRMVWRQTTAQDNITHLPEGIYMVTIRNADILLRGKIVLKK